MTPAELMARIDQGDAPPVVDVRSVEEFAAGHVPGATNVPFQEIASRPGALPVSRDATLVVYCGHGPRAWVAARRLRRMGYRHVTYLSGHWARWRRAGLPQERTTL
jgi:rhodanese-related sulfurtransferase